MRTAPSLLVAAKDLRLRLRDRSLLVYGVVAPLTLALIFSLLLGPLASGELRSSIGLVDEDRSTVSAGLRSALESIAADGVIDLRSDLDDAEARDLLDRGGLGAAVVVPQGFGAEVTSGGGPELLVVSSVDAPIAAQVAEGIAVAFADRLHSTSLAVQAITDMGGDAILPLLIARAAAQPGVIDLEPVPASARQLDPVTYYAAGMAVLFVFFIVQVGVTGLLDEQRDGTMARLLAAPMPRRAILTGKALTSAVLGIICMTVLALASTLFMGAEWGDPLGAALLIFAAVLAAAGIMALVAGLARTAEAAGNLQSIVAVTLAALGGSFIELPTGGGLLAVLTRLTPHHWFLSGLADLPAGVGAGAVLEEVGFILLFAAVTGIAGWILLGRKLRA